MARLENEIQKMAFEEEDYHILFLKNHPPIKDPSSMDVLTANKHV